MPSKMKCSKRSLRINLIRGFHIPAGKLTLSQKKENMILKSMMDLHTTGVSQLWYDNMCLLKLIKGSEPHIWTLAIYCIACQSGMQLSESRLFSVRNKRIEAVSLAQTADRVNRCAEDDWTKSISRRKQRTFWWCWVCKSTQNETGVITWLPEVGPRRLLTQSLSLWYWHVNLEVCSEHGLYVVNRDSQNIGPLASSRGPNQIMGQRGEPIENLATCWTDSNLRWINTCGGDHIMLHTIFRQPRKWDKSRLSFLGLFVGL